MPHGGYHPYPRRFGGAASGTLEVLHKDLNDRRGTAYDPKDGSVVNVENHALARAIVFDGWHTNDRLSLQWDPRCTTDMLARWERIFGITTNPRLSDAARRAELTRRWRAFGEGVTNHARMYQVLTEALGPFFGAIEYISLDNAVVHVPAATPSYPWGTVSLGVGWYSTVAHILVLLVKPAGATEADFYEAAGKVGKLLDPIVPAWVRFDWYRAPLSTPISVPGGPSQGGFYLDDEHNLDNNVFDE